MPVDLIFRLLPYALAAFLSAGLTFAITAGHYRAVIAENTLAAEKAVSEAQNRVIEQQKQQQTITSQVSTDYETKLREIRQHYLSAGNSNGVRVDATSGRVSAVPDTAGKPDGKTIDVVFVGQCAEVTQQLISLQDWVASQHKAGQ